ncbi:MAG: MerR family transcriptional regulator [Acidimicrobiales bacterium]
MVTYRVEELASAAGVSVPVIRSYQSRGLLPAPRHEGRVACYGPVHLERLRVIRDLKARGHSLRGIAALLAGRGAEESSPIADAVAAGEEEVLNLVELAERTRVPPAMLRSLEGSGVLRPQRIGGTRRYTGADVRAVRMLLSLIGSGLPMEDFMTVADVQLEAVDRVATGAVELFLRHVREPLLASRLSQREEAERLVAGLRLMLSAVTELISYSVRRTTLNLLQEELEQRGSRQERATLRRELGRRGLEGVRSA